MVLEMVEEFDELCSLVEVTEGLSWNGELGMSTTVFVELDVFKLLMTDCRRSEVEFGGVML
jgi:hypothetical protein